MIERIRLGEKPNDQVATYFLPKLTEEELELVEIKDTNYLQTFQALNPDVSENQESDSKFVEGWCSRLTFTIGNYR